MASDQWSRCLVSGKAEKARGGCWCWRVFGPSGRCFLHVSEQRTDTLNTGLIRRHTRRQRQAMSLLLVPALLLGSVPQPVCVCANGQVQRGCAGPACCQPPSGKKPDATCHCRCCTRVPGTSGACCAKLRWGDQPQPDERPCNPAGKAAGRPCCRQHVFAPPPASVSQSELWVPAVVMTPWVDWPVLQASTRDRLFPENRAAAIPPPDRIIWFSRLTI